MRNSIKNLIGILLILGSLKAGAQSSALAFGDSLYASGHYSKAIASYESVANPSPKTLLQIARAYNAKGVKGTALEYYKRSVQKDGLQPIALLEYGRLLLSQLKYDIADTVFTSLTQLYPDNPEYHYQLGRSIQLIERKNKEDSASIASVSTIKFPETAFAKAVQIDSTHQKAMYELSKIYLEERDYTNVEKIVNKALESDPENIKMIGLLAQNYYYKGSWTEAIEHFEKLISLGQSTTFIHDKLGRSYYQKRQYKKAIKQYEILLDAADDDWGLHLTLSRLYAFENELEKSIAYGKQALYLKDLPLDDVFFTLGRSYELKKYHKQALNHYSKALKENSHNADARYGLAVAADNYYEDKQEVLKMYEGYVNSLEESQVSTYKARLAALRIQELKRQIFMDGN